MKTPYRGKIGPTLVAGVLGALLLSACSSTKPYRANREALAAAAQEVDAGKFYGAVQRMERFLADAREQGQGVALQQFFAYYLLTRAHEEAAFRNSFIRESSGAAASFSLDGEGGARGPSRVGHLMAATYNASFGRMKHGAAKGSPAELDGEALLPEGLRTLGTRNAYAHMNLALLAIYSQLKFQDRVEEIVRGIPDLLDFDRCEELMDEALTPAAMRPWIYYAVFDYLKTREERVAYKFGIRARESAVDSHGTFNDELRASIADWIMNESKYEFQSSENIKFDPALEACTLSGEPNIEFQGILKE